MANNTLKFVVEVAADQATGALNAISTAVNQAGIRMKATMLGVGEAARGASSGQYSLESSLKSMRAEMVSGDRTINFFARSLNGIVPEASAAGQGIRLLADGLLGGFGLAFAIQGVMAGVELFTAKMREQAAAEKAAREETERHGQALNKLAYASALQRMRASYEASGGDPARIDRAAGRLERESEVQDQRNFQLERQGKALAEINRQQALLNGLVEKKEIGLWEPTDAAFQLKVEEELAKAKSEHADATRRLAEADKALTDARVAGKLESGTADKKAAEDAAAKTDREAKATKNLAASIGDLVAQRRRLFEIEVAEEARKGNYGRGSGLYQVRPNLSAGGEESLEEGAVRRTRDDRVSEARRAGQEIGQAYVDPMVRTFTHGLSQMLQGQMTFRDLMVSVWQTILDIVTNSISQIISTWITSKITESMVANAAADSEIAANASVAASGAAASQAGIPIIGPALAVGAMAAMLAAVMAMRGNLHSARAGYDVPNIAGDIPAFLHKREMVLPEEHADTIRSLRRGGGAMTVNINGSLVDGASVRRVVSDYAFQRELRRQTRRHG